MGILSMCAHGRLHNAKLGANCSIEKLRGGINNTPKFLFWEGGRNRFTCNYLYFSKIGDLLHEIKGDGYPCVCLDRLSWCRTSDAFTEIWCLIN